MGKMLVSETVEPFRKYLKGFKSLNTAKSYIAAVQDFMTAVEDKPIDSLSLEDIITYKAALFDRKISSSSIATKLSALSFYCIFLKKVYGIHNIIAEDVRGLRPRVSQQIPEYLEMWEISALIEACQNIEEEILIRLLYTAGLRASDLLNITEDDLFKEQQGEAHILWLKVLGKGDKQRVVPLNEETQQSLTRYIEYRKLKDSKPSKRLFPFTYSTLWYRVRKVARKGGMDAHPHLFRHSFATSLLDNHTDIRVIAEMLGHSSLNTTKRYAKVKPRLAVDAVRQLKIGPSSALSETNSSDTETITMLNETSNSDHETLK
jgi:site-specific recombinase XerD